MLLPHHFHNVLHTAWYNAVLFHELAIELHRTMSHCALLFKLTGAVEPTGFSGVALLLFACLLSAEFYAGEVSGFGGTVEGDSAGVRAVRDGLIYFVEEVVMGGREAAQIALPFLLLHMGRTFSPNLPGPRGRRVQVAHIKLVLLLLLNKLSKLSQLGLVAGLHELQQVLDVVLLRQHLFEKLASIDPQH